jgi:hypothetical protein
VIKGYPTSAIAALVLIILTSDWSHAQTFNQPGAEQTKPIKTIFDFKAELKLADKQEKEIRQALADLNRDLQLKRAKLTILSIELEDLVNKEGDLDQIKKNLMDQANLQASMRYDDFAASRRINKVLSAD